MQEREDECEVARVNADQPVSRALFTSLETNELEATTPIEGATSPTPKKIKKEEEEEVEEKSQQETGQVEEDHQMGELDPEAVPAEAIESSYQPKAVEEEES